MLILKPEKVNFQISTTSLFARYSEEAKADITVEGLLFQNCIDRDNYIKITLKFNVVAEICCKTINFRESNYNAFNIVEVKENDISDLDFWKENGYCANSGFYSVENSKWLEEMNSIYDPMKKLNLKHFLIEGYDSYIEVLAKDYLIENN
ncbi:MAG: hypothetical protein KGV59_03995 [Tenacibaculum sp.]|nr:hypothetical protein [Tenacibaculum sp.]